MLEQVARYDRRQAARSASVISRSVPADLASCEDCAKLGATERESAQLHAQEAAERSQRTGRTPMIYR
jgi:ribosome-binding protein aMBF1 (putative translation factor)